MAGKRILAVFVPVGLCTVLLWNIVYAQAATGVTVSITSPDNGTSVAAGVSITVTASAENCPDETGSNITYTWSGPGSFSPTTGASVQWTAPTSPGDATITVTASNEEGQSDTDSITVKVVAVYRMQYDQPEVGYTTITDTLYVKQGTAITFKALAGPVGTVSPAWPAGTPVWGGEATGTGETATVIFNTRSSSTTDFKTITAECGSSKVTVNMIVYSLAGTHVADDNFQGRSEIMYGVCELVDLAFSVMPADVTVDQMGGLKWTKVTGKGGLRDRDGGAGRYTCHIEADKVTLRLTIQSGPSKNQHADVTLDVVAPSGTRMERVPGTNVKHVQGWASAGIALNYWLEPKTVSFKYVKFGEGACETNGNGIYTNHLGHSANAFGEIGGGNSKDGCQVKARDYAWSGKFRPWKQGGTLTWNIPTQYYVEENGRRYPIDRQTHQATVQPNGKTKITKSGDHCKGEAAVGSPTKEY